MVCENGEFHIGVEQVFQHACTAIHRVGSQVIFVTIHSTEKCPTFFHNDVLSKSK